MASTDKVTTEAQRGAWASPEVTQQGRGGGQDWDSGSESSPGSGSSGADGKQHPLEDERLPGQGPPTRCTGLSSVAGPLPANWGAVAERRGILAWVSREARRPGLLTFQNCRNAGQNLLDHLCTRGRRPREGQTGPEPRAQ